MACVSGTVITLADGRALMYFGAVPDRPAVYPKPVKPLIRNLRG
jgi:hypothetical protein